MKHFPSSSVYILATMSNSMYMAILSYNNNGGGYKPAPDVIKIRLRLFVEKRYFRTLSTLRPLQRTVVVYCLHQQFQFSNGDIASTLSISNSTVSRDLQLAMVYAKSNKAFLDKVSSIEDYILYNAKYIH